MAGVSAEALTFSKRMKEGVEHLSQATGGFSAGGFGNFGGKLLFGAAIAEGLHKIGELGVEAAERAHDIELFSHEIGVSTGQVRAWEKAAREAHVSTEVLEKALVRLSVAAEKAAEKQRDALIDSAKAAADDNGVVVRGGSHSTPPKPTSKLVDASLFPKIDENFDRWAHLKYDIEQQVRQLYVKSGQIPPALAPFETFEKTLANRAGEATKMGETLRQELTKFGGNAKVGSLQEGYDRLKSDFQDEFQKHNIQLLDEHTAKLRKFAEYAQDAKKAFEAMERAEANAFSKTVLGKGGLDKALQGFFADKNNTTFNTPESEDPHVAQGAETFKHITGFLEGIRQDKFQGGLKLDAAAMNLLHIMSEDVERAKTGVVGLNTALDQVGGGPQIENIGQLRQGIEAVGKAAGDAARAIGSMIMGGRSAATPGAADDNGLAAGLAAGGGTFASGGYISGPGSGTSDSILARVSNGEFINTARAVGHYGAGFFAAANRLELPRFADGGLVGPRSLPAFASGGLVSGSGAKHTINLSIGGEHIGSVSADAHVATRLARFAADKQMTSAGNKPSWFQ